MSFYSFLYWMIKPLPVWNILAWMVLFVLVTMMSLFTWIFLKYKAISKKDIVIFLEKSNRFRLIYDDLRGKELFKDGKKEYYIKEPILNSRGKALCVWSDNKPEPLDLKYNKADWVRADSLTAAINNEIIKKLVELKSSAKDILLLVGSICGIISALCSIIVLLIQLGVIKK